MSLFSKFRRRRKSQAARDEGVHDQPKACVANNRESTEINVDYLALEPRRVLSADFTLLGGSLDLGNFSEINDENVTVDEASTFYRFQLSEGTWSGTNSFNAVGAGTSTLLVNKSAVSEINLNDDFEIGFDVTFDDVDFSPLNNMNIVTGGDIDQLGGTSVHSPQLSLTANSIDLSNASNDFGSISATSVNDILISDANQVVIFGADAELVDGKIEVQADGIVVASSMSADSIWLDSSQGIEQATSAGIEANELVLTGQGTFELDSVANDLHDVAADIDERLEIVSATGLTISELTCAAQVTCGINVTGDLDLQIENGDLTQSANAPIIVGGDAFLTTISGDICLTGGDCSGGGGNSNMIVGTISVSASGDVAYAQEGDLDIDGLTVAGNLNFSGNAIEFNSNFLAAGLFLQATDGVSLNGNSIDVTNLIVTGTGDFDFSATTNSIRNIAADVTGTLRVGSNVDLQIGTIALASCGVSTQICGVSVNGDLIVNLNDAQLSQSSSVIVSGAATFDVGTGDICLAGGDCDGDGENDNDFNRVTVASANEFEIADINDIIIIGLDVIDDAAIIAGNSMSTGQITLDGNLAASALLLQADDGVDQLSGAISAEQLMLEVDGDVHLCSDNQISSTTAAGQVSANIDGELFVRNTHAVELVDLDFTTKSGAVLSHNQFNIMGDLSVVSSGGNGNAIFDSTQVNVGGETQLIALGISGDIEVDDFNVVGAVGVATADGNVRLVNAHVNGVVFRGDDDLNADATEVCPHFEASTINGDLRVQALAGNISNEANALLNVTGQTTLFAGTDNASNVSGSDNEFDLKLGLEQNDDIRFSDTLSLIGRDASLSINDSVQLSDTFIGISTVTATDGGTLFMEVDGSVTHEAGAHVSADNVSISATDYIFFQEIDADRVAFSAQGFVDTNSLIGVPVNLPVDVDDALAPIQTDVDNEYGVIVSSQNDLLIGTVSDALGIQANQTGIFSSGGHAYVETTNRSDIQFDGTLNTDTIIANGTTFGAAAEMQDGHVLTAIAGGDLTISDNTILLSTTGSVTDISSFTTDEGADFGTVTNEGPQFQVFLPTPSDNPTTKTVNTDDTQFIGIEFGRSGDQNFIVEVAWADGVVDVLSFDSGAGNRFERISHTFSNDFLLLNFELPTNLSFFSDPAINLFDLEGATEINSVNDLNTNDNFVLAFSDSRPQGDLLISSVDRPVGVPRESVVVFSEQQVSFEADSSGFGQSDTLAEEKLADAYLVRLDDAGSELEETTQDLPDSTVTQDVVTEWKLRVEEGTQYPPGTYRIKWVESGVTFSIDFEKGAEEDLEPDELREVNEKFSPPTFDDPPEPDMDGVEDELFDDVRFGGGLGLIVPIGDKAGAIEATGDDELEEEVEIVVENLADSTSRSRFGLLATGIVAIELMRKNGTRSDLKMEQEELKATATEISFVKSARSRRRMQG